MVASDLCCSPRPISNRSCGMFAAMSIGTPGWVTTAARFTDSGMNVPTNSAAPWPTSTSYDRSPSGTVTRTQFAHGASLTDRPGIRARR